MDERGLSTVVNYALTLVVVGLLVSALLVGMTSHLGSQHDRVVRSELAVVGNQLAGELTTADRVAGTVGPNGTVELQADLARRVAGTTYLIVLDQVGSNRTEITLVTDEPDVTVTVSVETDHSVEEGRYHGGELTVVSNGTTLEVTDD